MRDELGWLMQQAVSPSAQMCREWERSDLALLVDGSPRLLVEGKALYGFDALNPVTRNKYVNFVRADLEKASVLGSHGVQVAATVLMTCPHTHMVARVRARRCHARQNAAVAERGEDLVAQATEEMWQALQTLGRVATIELGAGEAFDARVTTTMFIVRS